MIPEHGVTERVVTERDRPWPDNDALTPAAVRQFLQFLHTTAVNKVSGLTLEQASIAPIPNSPAMSPLGLIKHLTAVQRQHFQIHLAGADLPQLWSHEDLTLDFRIGSAETVESVVAAFDAEWALSQENLDHISWDNMVIAYEKPVRAGKLIVDVLQETARHVGHLDLLREMIDGQTGE